MARQVPSGTPTRSQRYVFPGSGRRLLVLSIAGGVALFAGLVAAYVTGAPRFVSPGDVATAHAPIDLRCVQCHDTRLRDVVDLRCERCHDPGGSERMTNAAHVLFGSGDSEKGARAEALACITCHSDHHGRQFPLLAVDDRECGRCHRFSSLGRHPEFAAVKAQIQTGLGFSKFPHDLHINLATKLTGKPCEGCHYPTTDLVAYEPIAFDRHCASCHTTKDGFVSGGAANDGKPAAEAGKTDPIAPALLALPAQIGEAWASTDAPVFTPAARGRVEVSNLRHRDRWLLYNALRFRRALDPGGESAERSYVRAQISYLEQQAQLAPLSAAQPEALAAWAATLEQEIASIDRQLAARTGPEQDARALQEAASAVQAIVGALAKSDPGLAAETAGIATASPAAAPAVQEDDVDARRARFDERRQALRTLLDAIAARGNQALAERAARLKGRVDSLGFEASAEAPDAQALQDGLTALDDLFRAVRDLQDPEGVFEAAQIAQLRELARERVAGGLAPEDFEERRRQLLALLDAIDRRIGEPLRFRVAELRQRVLAIRPGTLGDTDLRRVRAQKDRLLQRVRLEIELAATGDKTRPAVAAPLADRRATEAALKTLNAQLATLEGGSRASVPGSPEDRDALVNALEAMLGPCAKCHKLSGARIAPMTAAASVMPHSVFSHRPHVKLASDCVACHASVLKSKLATDVNVPGVANCQTCHKPSQTRADCATCHLYHPKSVAQLVGGL
jgi:mono/diheme cytochrome c family protein